MFSSVKSISGSWLLSIAIQNSSCPPTSRTFTGGGNLFANSIKSRKRLLRSLPAAESGFQPFAADRKKLPGFIEDVGFSQAPRLSSMFFTVFRVTK